MTEGLITRIGRWIDHRWETKATESMVMERWNNMENAQIKDKVELEDEIRALQRAMHDIGSSMTNLREDVKNLQVAEQPFADPTKDLADLKTRLEKIELYSGMTRKVDPTKPPVVKSAFQI